MQRLRFPPDSVECKAGDYLVNEVGPGRWLVHRVEDIVTFARMVPLRLPAGVELIEEQHLLDSRSPAYSNDLFLLLETFEASFPAKEQAIASVRARTLGASYKGRYANLKQFVRSRTDVISETTP